MASQSTSTCFEEKMAGLKSMETLNLSGFTKPVVILSTMWNLDVVSALVDGCRTELLRLGMPERLIVNIQVPGAFELPSAALEAAKAGPDAVAAVICIGVLIKGSTMHFEYISDAVSHGIMRVGLDTGVPTIFGVLTCLTDDQARERAGIAIGEGGPGHNHGIDWARTAGRMALLPEETAKALGAATASA